MPKATKEKQSKSTTAFPHIEYKPHLQLDELEPEQIYVIPNFLYGKECDALIKYFETHLPPVEAPTGKPKRGYAFRNNDRQSMENAQLAQELYATVGLQSAIEGVIADNGKKPQGLNSNIRVYRYRKGHSFGPHYDDSVQDKHTGLWTEWTLLIYLNEDMVGGETVFYKEDLSNTRGNRKTKSEPITVQPRKGMALLHRHGQFCLLHEAMKVTQGHKWVLRSDVIVG
ncbi:hypothetical protein BDB01DRAFT_784567 [Pilobolus umbonatus]|nr:hypothetical protein BDB01DRAFT_784567 [Pilobolus umbonatus]